MAKETIIKKVEKLLKGGWYSNFQVNMKLKSASADRELRRLRQNPPSGYVIKQRPKKIEGFNTCLEYKLVMEDEIDA